jgi:hypothetical protein
LPVKYMTFLFHSCFFFNLLYTFFFFWLKPLNSCGSLPRYGIL